MKSKSPFQKRSPLKLTIDPRPITRMDQMPEGRGTIQEPSNPTGTPRPVGNNPFQTTTDPNAFVGETTSQQRTAEQMRASNELRVEAGGTRGQASDAGFSGDVADDEVLMSQEGMGTNIASGDGFANNALINSGDAIGAVTTTTSGERLAQVGPNTNQTGYLDAGGNMTTTQELSDNPISGQSDDSWKNDTGAVTMPNEVKPEDAGNKGDSLLPEVAQTSNVQSSIEQGGDVPVDPAVSNANIPGSMGGKDMQTGCDNNYVGDGVLYNGM